MTGKWNGALLPLFQGAGGGKQGQPVACGERGTQSCVGVCFQQDCRSLSTQKAFCSPGSLRTDIFSL